MKKPVTIDLIAWFVFNAIAILARPFFPYPLGTPPEGYANAGNVGVGILAGLSWVVLRSVVREFGPAATSKVVSVIVTLLLALCPVVILVVSRSLFETPASLYILLAPVLFTGIIWGTVSALRNAQPKDGQLSSESALCASPDEVSS